MNEHQETPLQLAVLNGDREMVISLLEEGAILDERGREGATPLSCATITGDLDLVMILIDAGAEVDFRAEKDDFSETPLHQAVFCGHVEIANLLIESGADVDAPGLGDMSPLHLAAAEGNLELIDMLVQNGADLEALSGEPLIRTPLELVLGTGNFGTAAHLIGCGADDSALYLLAPGEVGLFSVGMDRQAVDEVSAAYVGSILEDVDLMLEGMTSPAVEITLQGDTLAGMILEIYPESGLVYRIKVLSDRFRTAEGFGVSSTVSELGDPLEPEDVFFGEGGGPLVIYDALEASLIMEPGDWWQMGQVQGDIPDETEIKAILIL